MSKKRVGTSFLSTRHNVIAYVFFQFGTCRFIIDDWDDRKPHSLKLLCIIDHKGGYFATPGGKVHMKGKEDDKGRQIAETERGCHESRVRGRSWSRACRVWP